MPRTWQLLPLLILLTVPAAAQARTAPFPIPDPSEITLGPGPSGGSSGRLALSTLQYNGPTEAPEFLPLSVWTVGGGRKHPKRGKLTTAKLSEGPLTFVPGGTLLAHTEQVAGTKRYPLFMADLSPSGRVRSDVQISDPAQPGAVAKGEPVVGADGTVAQRYAESAGDVSVPEWLTIRPGGAGQWTRPSAIPGTDFRHELRLGADGTGAVVSAPLGVREGNALLISRFGRDGQLEPPVRVDLSGLRVGEVGLDLAATVTDSGTVVAALSVPGPTGSGSRGHLLLITLAHGSTTPSVQDVGPAVSPDDGTTGAIDAATTGGDSATVLAGGTPGGLRILDTQTAATPTWAPSMIAGPTGYDADLFRLHRGGLAAVWAGGGKRSTILGSRRAAGAPTFTAPRPLSRNRRARGEIDVSATALLADDEVLVAYARYGTRSEGDGAYALIGRP